jgi:exodeoxyribonuclease VII large subunit
VITRGGGSIEDLWTFNEEMVARAIHACPVPVVSAVGHEVDFTIADFVADFRAPTPSAAAERLSPVLKDLQLALRTSEGRLRKAAERHVLLGHERLVRLSRRLADPRRILGQKRLLISEEAERMVRALRAVLKSRREVHRRLQERLARRSPQAKLRAQRKELNEARERLFRSAGWTVRGQREQQRRLTDRFARANPLRQVHEKRRALAVLEQSLARVPQRVGEERQRFVGLVTKLQAMSPLEVLARGYAVAFGPDGHVLRGAGQVKRGDAISVRLAPAGARTLEECEEIDATVTATRPKQ